MQRELALAELDKEYQSHCKYSLVSGRAKPNEKSYKRARLLLELLPDSIADPEVGVDPDGLMSLLWIRSGWDIRSFWVRVDGENDVLMFSGIYGSGRMIGREQFSQDSSEAALQKVVANANKVFSDE
jgi:hypothetical protein